MRLFKSYREGVADGGQLRDFVYVRDVADVIEWLAGRPDVNGVFNLGSGRARSFKELAEAVFRAAGQAAADRLHRDAARRSATATSTSPRPSSSGCARAGYDGQFTSLEDGVADYVRGYLSQPDPYL